MDRYHFVVGTIGTKKYVVFRDELKKKNIVFFDTFPAENLLKELSYCIDKIKEKQYILYRKKDTKMTTIVIVSTRN